MEIEIFTDGASRGNPGPGGYGVVMKSGRHYKELSGGFRLTTNNRMELLAVIKGLEAIKKRGASVSVFSDSSYVVKAVNEGWLYKWKIKNFTKAKNPDLWRKFIEVSAGMNLKLVWVKGHAGHPENERCDRLAVEASLKPDLPEDTGYNPDSGATVQTLLP
jgi:ribonuclease HI